MDNGAAGHLGLVVAVTVSDLAPGTVIVHLHPMEVISAVATTSMCTLVLMEIVAKLMEIGENGLSGLLVVVTAPGPEPGLAIIQAHPMEAAHARVTASILFLVLMVIVER